MICLVLHGSDRLQNDGAMDFYRDSIDCVEYRYDCYGSVFQGDFVSWANSVYKKTGLRGILTIRTLEDGGSWGGDDEQRRLRYYQLIQNLEPGVLAWVDIEHNRNWPEVMALCKERGISLIRSVHDFKGTATLPVLLSFFTLVSQQPHDIIKYAAYCHGNHDFDTLVKASHYLKGKNIPFIVLGMGEYGQPTRILAKKLGSILTYASDLRPKDHGPSIPAAPGQLDPHTLQNLYGYGSISSKTLVYGIMGNPVSHSKSPAFHNPRLREAGLDAVYVPFLVDNPELFIQTMVDLDARGFSVTIPHKESVPKLAHELNNGVGPCGAGNTLIRKADTWVAYNTDIEGFMTPLLQALKETIGNSHPGIGQHHALILGAGGAARAIVWALAQGGWKLTIANRNVEKARGLCNLGVLDGAPKNLALGLDLVSLEKNCPQGFDVIINTTSVGMGGGDEEPLPGLVFKGTEVVYDVIYTPPMTRFLTRAREAGCRVINGAPMFEIQATRQAELFIEAGTSQH